MERFKKLSNQCYSLDLYTGKTNFKHGHNILCFFIVEHPCSEEFIKEQALQLLTASCRYFVFYGTYSRQWDICFDVVDVMVHPNDREDKLTVTDQWNDFDMFVSELHRALSGRYLVPCDTYLIYDDESTYHRVIQQLKEYDNIKRFHPDW